MAHIPAFARSARLGITRMSFTFAPKALRSFASVLPATMETSVCVGLRSGFTSAATDSMSCGRTARKIVFAVSATVFTSSVVMTPYFFVSSSARASTFSAMMTPDLSAMAQRMPSAIFPAPKKPILMALTRSLLSQTLHLDLKPRPQT